MYFFIVTAVFFLGNAFHSFHESRNWAHFIAHSNGTMPWPTPPDEQAEIWRKIADAEPTLAEFELYNAMLITSAAMLVMGLVFLRLTCLAKGVTWKKKEWMAKRAFKRSAIVFVVFLLAYGASKYSCAKLMNISEVLQNNGTIEAPHPRRDRQLQEWQAHNKPSQQELDEMFREMEMEMDEALDAMMQEDQQELDSQSWIIDPATLPVRHDKPMDAMMPQKHDN
jgi:hypothetical protein